MKSIPIVAIVGRPNVGKSSLFNRLVGRRESIVSHVSGTTRDRIMAETTWYEFRMMLVDTGGLDVFPNEDIWKQVKYQIDVAIEDADVIMMVVDSFDGVTDADKDALKESSGQQELDDSMLQGALHYSLSSKAPSNINNLITTIKNKFASGGEYSTASDNVRNCLTRL